MYFLFLSIPGGRDNKIKMHPPVVNSNGQCELRPPAFVSNDDEDEDPNEFPGVVDLNTVYANMSNSEFGPGTINSDEEYDGDSDEVIFFCIDRK